MSTSSTEHVFGTTTIHNLKLIYSFIEQLYLAAPCVAIFRPTMTAAKIHAYDFHNPKKPFVLSTDLSKRDVPFVKEAFQSDYITGIIFNNPVENAIDVFSKLIETFPLERRIFIRTIRLLSPPDSMLKIVTYFPALDIYEVSGSDIYIDSFLLPDRSYLKNVTSLTLIGQRHSNVSQKIIGNSNISWDCESTVQKLQSIFHR